MKLALFLPGAYIWPVHRSFEAFLASLAAPARDELTLLHSPVYPATFEAEPPLGGIDLRLDARLLRLHRELYDAMLRPLAHHAADERSIAEAFWPDLAETALGQLFEAFLFYFTHRTASATPVPLGLSVIRAVFFNHEAAEPEHWLYSSTRRLAALRDTYPELHCEFLAPPSCRVQDLAFVAHSGLDRPPGGAGWIKGVIRRWPDGLCRVELNCGRDPALAEPELLDQAAPRIEAEMQAVVRHIFGWAKLAQEAAA